MVELSDDNEKLFGEHTDRIKDVCERSRVDFDRVCKSFRCLAKQDLFKGQSKDALVDYMETRVKMLSFGAIPCLPGEE